MFPDIEITLTRDYLMTERQSLLLKLEAIEKLLGIAPRTSEIRKAAKDLTLYVEPKEKKVDTA